jgi:hypothetical protein
MLKNEDDKAAPPAILSCLVPPRVNENAHLVVLMDPTRQIEQKIGMLLEDSTREKEINKKKYLFCCVFFLV